MRRLRLEMPSNFTLEHIVPNKITKFEWDSDRVKYERYPNLQPQNITVCPKDAHLKTVAFGMLLGSLQLREFDSLNFIE